MSTFCEKLSHLKKKSVFRLLYQINSQDHPHPHWEWIFIFQANGFLIAEDGPEESRSPPGELTWPLWKCCLRRKRILTEGSESSSSKYTVFSLANRDHLQTQMFLSEELIAGITPVSCYFWIFVCLVFHKGSLHLVLD